MPALPPVPNVLKVVMEGTTPDFPWANVLHFAYSGSAPVDTTCTLLAADFYNAWAGSLGHYLIQTGTIERCVVTDLTSSTSGEGEHVLSTPGVLTGTALPANTAVLVSKTIARRYRGGHPRSYLFLGDGAFLADAAHWTSGFAATAEANYNIFINSMFGVTEGGTIVGSEVIVSYIDKALNPVPPYRRTTPLVTPVAGTSVGQLVANQRRRVGR